MFRRREFQQADADRCCAPSDDVKAIRGRLGNGDIDEFTPQSYEGDEGRGSWRLLLQEGNYNAAISRYREALDFKPHDAEATFKLAKC